MIAGDIGLMIFETVFAVFLLWLSHYSEKVLNSKWRLLYAIPLIVSINIVGFIGFEIAMVGVYIGAVLLLYGFFCDRKKGKCISSSVCLFLIFITIPICMNDKGYRAPDYVQDFKRGFTELKKHYILGEHKGIEWDELYNTYLPAFRKVQSEHDEVENIILWQKFCQEFYDGHVTFVPDAAENVIQKANDKVFGNDYGLSMMRLATGEFVAVNVEAGGELTDAGIHNGTVIVKWDGKGPQDYYDDVTVMAYSQPDRENREFYLPIYVSGMGGEAVEIDFIDDSGEQNRVTIHKIGSYTTRLQDTLEKLDHGMQAANLSFTMVGDKTALFRISEMIYDSASYSGTDYSAMKEEIRIKIMELREKGILNLIIDLRNNGGGSPHMMMAVASLLAPEGMHSYASVGEFDEKSVSYKVDSVTKKYVTAGELSYYGENLFADGQIVILVNAECISAGDHMVLAMSDFSNVTVMGFTKSNGSGQAVSSVMLESGQLTYSLIPTLDEQGNILIDSGTDHEIGIDLDVKIPFDEKAVKALFDEGEDYILDYAVDYLE